MFNNLNKKIISVIYFILLFIVFTAPISMALAQTPQQNTATYVFLAPISTETTFDASQDNALSVYLNIIIKTLIGAAGVLAMIMIVMGGVEYMTSGLVSSKEEGKKRVTDAVIGLLLALSAYLLLFTINPNLLKTIDTGNKSKDFESVNLSQNIAGVPCAIPGQTRNPLTGVCSTPAANADGKCTGFPLATNQYACETLNGGVWVPTAGTNPTTNAPKSTCTIPLTNSSYTAQTTESDCAKYNGVWTPP